MKTSQILKQAKWYLSDGSGTGEQFICWAVGQVSSAAWPEQRRLKKMITERLQGDDRENGSRTLEDWLQRNHSIKTVGVIIKRFKWVNEEEVKVYRAKIQRTRHAWLDSMIEEFEAKGD